MNKKYIEQVLHDYREGNISIDNAVDKLRTISFEDLEFAKIDNQRAMRQGFPEVIYCEGKTPAQVGAIMEKLAAYNNNILATRANMDTYKIVQKILPEAVYYEEARLIAIEKNKLDRNEERFILVLTAGTSDIPIAEEAAITAEIMGNKVRRLYDVGVAGIHRLFAHYELLQQANVIIAIAGMEGALASVVGGLVSKPVIAVPTSIGYGSNFHGLSALLGMLNSCAAGVAVVNIDNGFGAGRLASIINHMR